MPDCAFMHKPATVVDFGLSPEQEQRANALHERILVFDGLLECTWYDEAIALFKAGGVTGGNLSLGVTDMHGWRRGDSFPSDLWWSWQAMTHDLNALAELIAAHPEELMACAGAEELRQAKASGRVGLIPGVQNADFLNRDIRRLDEAHALGLRIVQLTYNRANHLGAGCMEPERAQFGLSRFGEEVVGRMNELGLLVDTGHCSTPTLLAALDASSKPIACSHAGLRAKVNQPRSHPDEALRRLAGRGGVFGVVSAPGALNGRDRCHVNDYLDNLEHAINVMGIDHVGFASDFLLAASLEQVLSGPDWGEAERSAVNVSPEVWPFSNGHEGMENHSGYPNLTRGLVARGYGDQEIAKVMGGNWLRLIAETMH